MRGWKGRGRAYVAGVLSIATMLSSASAALAINLPSGFVDDVVIGGIDSPAGFKFAPDGRLFFSERITGTLRTATYDAGSEAWMVEPLPYATFDIPVDGGGVPEAHRSSGLRDFAFDPDFASNGYVYVFYMKHNPRHNRVVRIQQDPADVRQALPTETVLLDLPFNSSSSSGSHNGGAVDFGSDGKLYIATGDGWNGGDGVQSLGTYTGKLFRIEPDGSIPVDNPFFASAAGPLRAIYALGLRNPYSMTFNPTSGFLYVNEANGADKTNILRVTAGANYGHQGYGGIGVSTGVWHSTYSGAGGKDKLITGGAWYSGATGTLPAEYAGRLFVCHWGSNGSSVGVIRTVASESDLTTELFADNVDKPVTIRVGPDGHLYYMDTTYETSAGAIHRIRYTGQAATATPEITPAAGTYFGSVQVMISSVTSGAQIYYTTDGSDPTQSSALYVGPLTFTETTTVRARAFRADLDPSGIAESAYTLCADASCNQPPVANAGADRTVLTGQQAFLSGSASFDPDTSELLLSDTWRQASGEPVTLLNDDETVAYFTPTQSGCYSFEYEIADEVSVDVDTVDILSVPCLDSLPTSLIAEWRFDEGEGVVALETATGSNHGALEGPLYASGRTTDAGTALDFDGVDDAVDLGTFDIDSSELTLSAWIQIDDFDQMDGRVLAKADGVQEADHIWMLSTIASAGDHVLRFRLRTGGSTTTLIATGTPLPTGSWIHVAATYDGSTMRIWQNGVDVAQAAKTGMIDTDPTMPVAVGNQPARDRPFDGRIDEVRLFDRSLDPSEIQRLASFHRPFDVDQDGMVESSDVAAFQVAPFDLNGDAVVDAADEACLSDYLVHRSCTPPPPTGACPDTPAAGCVGAFGSAQLVLKETTPGREKIVVKMKKGPALLAEDFGDPLSPGGTAYTLCLFDDAGALVGQATVDRAGQADCAGKDCWRALGPLGFQYRDRDLTSDGMQSVRLKGGSEGASLLLWKGKNNASKGQVALPVPLAAGLAGSTEAIVQVHTDDGTGCFTSTLGDVSRSDPDFFKARN